MRLATLSVFFSLCSGLSAQVAVVNGASFRPEQPLVSGSWASAFGTFAGVTTTSASELPLPKTLGGVAVTVDGVDAPLNFVSSGQINFLIPYQAAPGVRSVRVRTSGATLDGVVRVIPAAPGVFVADNSVTPPRGAILNQDFSVNSAGSPARPGQVIQIFGTGPGALDGSIADGAAAPRSPLLRTRSTPQVFIGGVAADVQFSGLAPDFVGLWQVNAFVPNQPFVNGRVAVQIFMDGVDSNEVTVAISR